MSFNDWANYMGLASGNGSSYGYTGGSDPYGTVNSPNATDIGGSNSGWGSVLGSIFGNNNSSSGGGNNNSNSGSIFSSPSWSDLLAGAKLGYSIIKSNQPPKFSNVPMSPEQQKLWDLYYQYQTDPSTSNNRAIVSGYARDTLNSMHPTWTPPKTSTGETGYNGTAGRSFSNIPAFDWTGYMGGGVKANTTPSNLSAEPAGKPGATIGTTGVSGNGGVFAPVGSSGDPFANLPSGFTQSVDPSDLSSFISKYGKGAMELVLGIYSLNPVLGGKGAMDLYRSLHSSNNDPAAWGPQETANTLSNNPAGAPPPSPSYTQQRAGNFIGDQTLGLMFGGGMGTIPGYSGGGGFFGTDDDAPGRLGSMRKI